MKKKLLLISLIGILLIGCSKENTIEIELKSNPTTGYGWVCDVQDENILKIVKNEYKSDNHSKDLVGVGGNDIFTFSPVNEGTTAVKCEYKRSWEDTSEYSIEYNVKVDSDLKITSTSTGNYENIPEMKSK